MRTTKNRLFKTLTMVMLLFIMAFTVTGNTFAESTEVPTVNVDCTKVAVTVSTNCNCDVKITILVKDGPREATLTKSIHLSKNETKELTIEDFVSDYYSDEAIITHVLSVGATAGAKIPEIPAIPTTNFILFIILIVAAAIVAIVHILNSKKK